MRSRKGRGFGIISVNLYLIHTSTNARSNRNRYVIYHQKKKKRIGRARFVTMIKINLKTYLI